MVNQFDDSKLFVLLNEKTFSKIDSFLNQYGMDSVDRDGRTVLMSAIMENKIELVSHLISIGCNINAKDKQGLTALHLAAMYDFKSIVELLLSHNIVIDVEDHEGNTPLWRAAMNSDEMTESIKLLLDAGADRFKNNKHGVSPDDLLEDEEE